MGDFYTFYPEARYGGFSDVDGTVRFYTRARALADGNSVVLDVGCGRGERFYSLPSFVKDLAMFKGRVQRVIGIDVDPIGATNPSLDEFRKIEGDRWPVEDYSVDLVISDFVLEHLFNPDAFFDEVRRVLRPGGRLAVRTPNKWGYVAVISRLVPNSLHSKVLRRAQAARPDQDIFPTFYRCNSVGAIRRQLRRIGFDHCVYTHEPEPAYLGFSKIAFALGVFYQRFAPRWFRATVVGFGTRKEQ